MSLGPYWVGDTPTDTIIVDLVRNGSPLPITGYTSASITLTRPSGSAVDVSTADVDLVGSNSVTFTFPDVENLFTEPGIYTLQVLLHKPEGTDRGALIPVEVRAADTGTDYGHWATPANVLQIAGAVVDTDDIIRAEAAIDAFTGAKQLASLSTHDLYYLRQATAFQAAWAQEQPDLYSRHDIQRMNQDQFDFTTRDMASLILAPYARLSLSRLSWAGGKQVRVAEPRPSYGTRVQTDDMLWQRL